MSYFLRIFSITAIFQSPFVDFSWFIVYYPITVNSWADLFISFKEIWYSVPVKSNPLFTEECKQCIPLWGITFTIVFSKFIDVYVFGYVNVFSLKFILCSYWLFLNISHFIPLLLLGLSISMFCMLQRLSPSSTSCFNFSKYNRMSLTLSSIWLDSVCSRLDRSGHMQVDFILFWSHINLNAFLNHPK